MFLTFKNCYKSNITSLKDLHNLYVYVVSEETMYLYYMYDLR
jgi:hypothetical protein